MATKYIRNQFKFLVFHESIQHREMAVKSLGRDALIHSAGFIKLLLEDEKIKAQCYGESESLSKKPRRDDNENILKAIGVENQEEVEHAKYVIWRGKAVVFSNELEHQKVAQAAFHGYEDCESAGFVKFLYHPSGKIKVQCYGESMSLGVSARKEDYKTIANLMEIPQEMVFTPSTTLNLK